MDRVGMDAGGGPSPEFPGVDEVGRIREASARENDRVRVAAASVMVCA